jgi:hypothetical protein
MTDRHAGYVVTLADNVRDDDAEATIAAIRQIKGVRAIEPVVADPKLHIAHIRAQQELSERLWKALQQNPEWRA